MTEQCNRTEAELTAPIAGQDTGQEAADAKRQICIMLPPLLIDDLKVLAIRQKTTVSALLEAAAMKVLEARPE